MDAIDITAEFVSYNSASLFSNASLSKAIAKRCARPASP